MIQPLERPFKNLEQTCLWPGIKVMKVEDATKLIDSNLEKLHESLASGKSEVLEDVLRTMAKFHKYSLSNIMLILCQKEDATMVAGFNRWKELGRFVKAGEKGIAILVPMQLKAAREDESRAFKFKPKEELDSFLKEHPDAEVQSFTRFRVGYVFDVSQTDGAPLPELDKAKGDPGCYSDRLKSLVKDLDIELEYQASLGGAYGVSFGGRIELLEGMEPGQEFQVLVHELAHELLHKGDDRKDIPRHQRELEAEAVAFVVAESIGLDTGSASSDYIQLYRGDPEALKASLTKIRASAGKILDALLT